jgi:hypothetical protein
MVTAKTETKIIKKYKLQRKTILGYSHCFRVCPHFSDNYIWKHLIFLHTQLQYSTTGFKIFLWCNHLSITIECILFKNIKLVFYVDILLSNLRLTSRSVFSTRLPMWKNFYVDILLSNLRRNKNTCFLLFYSKFRYLFVIFLLTNCSFRYFTFWFLCK